MGREERVTVQGPVKEQQLDGMSHRGFGWGKIGHPQILEDRGSGLTVGWDLTRLARIAGVGSHTTHHPPPRSKIEPKFLPSLQLITNSLWRLLRQFIQTKIFFGVSKNSAPLKGGGGGGLDPPTHPPQRNPGDQASVVS